MQCVSVQSTVVMGEELCHRHLDTDRIPLT